MTTTVAIPSTKTTLELKTRQELITFATALRTERQLWTLADDKDMRTWKKDELVEYIWTEMVSPILVARLAEKANAEATRAQQVAAGEATAVNCIRDGMRLALDTAVAECQKKVETLKADAAKDLLNFMVWRGETFAFEMAKLDFLVGMQHGNQSDIVANATLADVVAMIEESIESHTDRALETTRSYSTGQVTNLVETQKALARNWIIKFMKVYLKTIRNAMAGKDVRHHWEVCSNVY